MVRSAIFIGSLLALASADPSSGAAFVRRLATGAEGLALVPTSGERTSRAPLQTPLSCNAFLPDLTRSSTLGRALFDTSRK